MVLLDARIELLVLVLDPLGGLVLFPLLSLEPAGFVNQISLRHSCKLVLQKIG